MIKLFNIMKKNFINKRRRGKMKQGKKIVAILLALSLCLPFNLVTQAAKKTIVNAQYSLCKGNSILVKKTGLKG